MKELIKPNENESNLNEVNELCEVNCNSRSVPCNRFCDGAGTTNESISEGNDIIF
jgi:hypothetical protein